MLRDLVVERSDLGKREPDQYAVVGTDGISEACGFDDEGVAVGKLLRGKRLASRTT